MAKINQNTIDLQDILTQIKALPNAGGSESSLPTLANEGIAADLMFGKELINGEGSKITGTFTINSEITEQNSLIEQIAVALESKVNPEGETKPIVAKIGDAEYSSVASALKSANNGDTVILVADSDESSSNLVIPYGVTLDLQAYHLTANKVDGLFGGLLTGMRHSTANATAGTLGRLTVSNKDSLKLSKQCFLDPDQIAILPIWLPNESRYEFTAFRSNTSSLKALMVDNNLRVQFGISSVKHTTSNYFVPDLSIADNGFSVWVEAKFIDIFDCENIFQTGIPDSFMAENFSQGKYVDFSYSEWAQEYPVEVTLIIKADCGIEYRSESITYTHTATSQEA